MDIYVVQPGDNIYSIADKYGVSVDRIIQENGIVNPFSLVPGQTIVITYPNQIHVVVDGDTLSGIADSYGVTVMQLLRNNPFLLERNYLYTGETLVISYNTTGKINTNGYVYPFINRSTLINTLPFLTHLSVFNYRIKEDGEIQVYGDDSEIVQLAKNYGVVPLLMISSISLQGVPNIEVVYRLLLNKDYQELIISNTLNILRNSGYLGINMLISGINTDNQHLYIDLFTIVSEQLKENGYQFFITINPNLEYIDDSVTFEHLDYSTISNMVNNLTFFDYTWGRNPGPPGPISSINLIHDFIEYLVTLVLPEKISVGIPIIGYDWELPYIPNTTSANSVTVDSAIILATDTGSIILFDEVSMTPYYYYKFLYAGGPVDHVVWFIDARSINALLGLINQYKLSGCGIWNIMIKYQQLWTLINSQYDIIKIIPDNIT